MRSPACGKPRTIDTSTDLQARSLEVVYWHMVTQQLAWIHVSDLPCYFHPHSLAPRDGYLRRFAALALV